MTAVVWTALGLLAATLGLLATALFQLRTELRDQLGEFRTEFRSDIRGELADLGREMREGFAYQGERIDHLATRIDAHIERHAG